METNNKKKVSFDFDGTLNGNILGYDVDIQKLLVELVDSDNFDVYIITRRYGPENSDKGFSDEHTTVFNLLDTLNIQLPKEKILFTNRKYKFSYINTLKVDIHLDDDSIEHQLIAKYTSGSSVDVHESDWRMKFDGLL